MAQTRAIVDKLLSQASSMLVPEGFLCEKILPPVYVTQDTGKIAKYGTNHLRIETTIAGGRGAYRRVDSVARSTDSYSIESHGLEDVVTAADRRNVETPYEAEEDVVNALTILLHLKKEKGLADTLTDTAVMTQNTTLVGTAQYSHEDSDPVTDFGTYRAAVRSGFGFAPNTAIMDWAVYNKLRFHAGILDYLGFKLHKPGGLEESALATALGVDRILIAKAVYNSAVEGQTDVIVPVWGKHIVLAYVPESAGRYSSTLGFRLQLASQRSGPRSVYKHLIHNPPNTTSIICEDQWDMVITNPLAGYLIKNAIA